MKGKTTYFTEYLRYKHDSFFEGSVAFTFQLKQISLSTTRTKAYLLISNKMLSVNCISVI
jgi:hypothetical protein